jgi:hypothetical protein
VENQSDGAQRALNLKIACLEERVVVCHLDSVLQGRVWVDEGSQTTGCRRCGLQGVEWGFVEHNSSMVRETLPMEGHFVLQTWNSKPRFLDEGDVVRSREVLEDVTMAVGEAIGVDGDDLWVPVHEIRWESRKVVVTHK